MSPKSTFQILAFLGLYLLSFSSLHAQKIKIYTSDEVIETSLVGSSSEAIYTQAGTYTYTTLSKIVFAEFEEKFEELYFSLAAKTTVEFEDGFKLDSLENYSLKLNQEVTRNQEFTAPLTRNYRSIQPGDYLRSASGMALTGVAVTIIGGAASALLGDPLPAVVGGALGLGLQIGGWAQIGQAGKAMQEERRLRELENQ